MKEMEQIFRIFDKYEEDVDFCGPVSETAVRLAEEKLGVEFPQDYRIFLKRCGAGSFGGCEIYGIVPDGTLQSIPNGIWATEYLRMTWMIPNTCIVFAFDGLGGYYCMDTSKSTMEGSCQVILITPNQIEWIENSFSKFLLNQLKMEIDSMI